MKFSFSKSSTKRLVLTFSSLMKRLAGLEVMVVSRKFAVVNLPVEVMSVEPVEDEPGLPRDSFSPFGGTGGKT